MLPGILHHLGAAIFLLSFALNLSASASSAFDQANRLYEQKKYPQAIALYQSLLTNKTASAELYFNLGNAYFKNGEIGRALLNYRRAELLRPRDPDLQANIRFTRDSISGSSSIPQTILDRAAIFFTLNELAIAFAIFFWLWLILLGLRQFRPSLRPQLRGFITLSTISLFLSTAWLLGAWVKSRQTVAIVVAREAIIRLGPLDESGTAFAVPDGTELRVLSRKDKWVQLSDRQNRVGWIKPGAVVLFP